MTSLQSVFTELSAVLFAVTCQQAGNKLAITEECVFVLFNDAWYQQGHSESQTTSTLTSKHRSMSLYNAKVLHILVLLYSGCRLVVGCNVTET